MTSAAIPTRYNGVNFRSRLEARYAAYFDLLRLEWQYEPLDLNGYIPDFLVRTCCQIGEEGECGHLEYMASRTAEEAARWPEYPFVLIEVKPALAADQLAEAAGKLDAAWGSYALIVGAHPGISIYTSCPVGREDRWQPGSLNEELDGGRDCGVGRACGFDHPIPPSCPTHGQEALWREAGNRVQWNPVTPWQHRTRRRNR